MPFDTSTQQTSFAQAMHNNVGSNKLVGTQMQAPLQRIQKQNPIYGQQANVPAAMPIWTAPIHANRFPTTGVQTVQVPAMAYPQPSKLQSAAPAQSILTNRPSGMPLNQPNTQQSQSTPNKKEVHPDNFDGTGKQNV